jgi:hypothetical protein
MSSTPTHPAARPESTARTDSAARLRPSTPGSSAHIPLARVDADLSATDVRDTVVAVVSGDAAPGDSESCERCPVCETERLGAHCVDCGHAFQDDRLRLRPLLRRGFTRVFDLDDGLLHTFLELFRRPGGVAKDYASGIRRPYVNPFTYFVLAAAIQIVGMRIMWEPMSRALSEYAITLEDENNIYFHIFGENWAQEYTELTLSFMAQTYTWMAFMFFAIPLAVALRLFMGKRLMNLAEGMVFALYTSGHMLLLTVTAVWVVVFTDSIWYQQVMVYPIMIGWTMYAIVSYFGRSARTFVIGGVAMVLAVLCYLLATTIGMVVNTVAAVGIDQIVAAFQQMAAQ